MNAANAYAQQAIAYDKAERFDAAIYSYLEAARLIIHLIERSEIPESCREFAQKYFDRAEALRRKNSNVVSVNTKSEHQTNVERAEFLLNEALEKDRAGECGAQELYAQSVEFCLKCSKSAQNDSQSAKFRRLALTALERAESLKEQRVLMGSSGDHATQGPSTSRSGDDDSEEDFITQHLPEVPVDEITQLNLSHDAVPAENRHFPPSDAFNPSMETASSEAHSKKLAALTESELRVLALTSRINNKSYVPFLDCDLQERFAYVIPFSDKDGLLALSEKQRSRLKCWMRPDEFAESPTVIDCIDSGTIKQTIVSDCSFIASLAIAARYERRFGKRLITNIIYPQNRAGEPIHNPCGKYMVRLHINGIWRKVIIDDRLPIGSSGELLCSYSQNKNELWVSLLEKAYMKIMGGYDFPGSNSNIDLNALTGWIPERIAIRPNSVDFQPDKVFERLFNRFHNGDCLITLATGEMPKAEQERTGLVDAHAYAVLDLRKINGKRLLLVKNPWTHLRWKGRYSERDATSWTPKLRAALNYNPDDAQQFDDGVFWIDYESVCAFFDVFYVNWNQALFPFRYVLHSSWSAGVGPIKDLYTIGDNPQYFLEVNNTKHGTASVWILLTRHIVDKEDFANNKEYITVVVYKGGKRVYLPHEPKPMVDGARINSPHYLCQMLVTDEGLQRFTLVVAQYEKSNTIYYTLRVYSSAEFRCGELKVPYKKSRKHADEWKAKTAGGCGVGTSRNTYQNNPLFHLTLDDGSDENTVLVELRGPKEYSVGFEVTQVSARRPVTTRPFERRDSGAFRPGYTVLQLDGVPSGVYAIRPMTFVAGQEGPFLLRVDASCDFKLKRVQSQ